MEKPTTTPREQQLSSRDQTSNAQETPSEGHYLAWKIYRLHGRLATKRYARKVTTEEQLQREKWYPLHHPVFHPQNWQSDEWSTQSVFSKILKETALIRGNCSRPLRDCLGENVVEYPQFDDKIALANKFSDLFKRLRPYRLNSTTWFRPLLSALPTSTFVMYRLLGGLIYSANMMSENLLRPQPKNHVYWY